MLIEVKVQSLGLDRNTNNPVVILRECEGSRILPIWIGPGEASAIAVQMASMEFPRPLTHDLLAAVLGGLGGTLERINITRMEGDTYYAEMIIRRNGEVFSVDARPSDSIAVALRTDARIFADQDLLEHAQVEISGSDDPGDLSSAGLGSSQESRTGTAGGEADAETLEEYLRRLNPEDFGRFTP